MENRTMDERLSEVRSEAIAIGAMPTQEIIEDVARRYDVSSLVVYALYLAAVANGENDED